MITEDTLCPFTANDQEDGDHICEALLIMRLLSDCSRTLTEVDGIGFRSEFFTDDLYRRIWDQAEELHTAGGGNPCLVE